MFIIEFWMIGFVYSNKFTCWIGWIIDVVVVKYFEMFILDEYNIFYATPLFVRIKLRAFWILLVFLNTPT